VIMKRSETKHGSSPFQWEDIPKVSREQLSDEELAFEAQRLIVDFKQALYAKPEFRFAATMRILDLDDSVDTRTQIPFIIKGTPYDLTDTSVDIFFVQGKKYVGKSLYITRKPQGDKVTKREQIALKSGAEGQAGYEADRWGMVQYGIMIDPGTEPEYHTNTPQAIEKVEAFLHDLQ